MLAIQQLTQKVSAVCPIDGVADNGDGTYRIDFKAEATAEQQAAAIAVVSNFVPAEPPSWDDFQDMISIEPAYLRIVTEHPANQAVNTLLVAAMWQLESKPHVLSKVALYWNVMVANVPPTAEEVDRLQSIASDCNMEILFSVNAQGQIVLANP